MLPQVAERVLAATADEGQRQAIVVDDLVSTDPWTPRMLEIRGPAEAIPTGGAHLGSGFGEAFIRIHPDKVNSFGIE
ncbi:thiamine pyrophosphate-dependent acetolactate synthase large subunit-like protein [Streptacidiphilus sp. MAP12-33]|uniref:hypothetical protein n=1 Tax=Streptacidiphilus sp. MAP12-33 TaxID=3156266 RepID=UPI003511CE6E